VFLKLSCTGFKQWMQILDCTEGDLFPSGISVDPLGQAVLALYTDDSAVDVGGGMLTPQGGYDLIIGKFDSDGNELWSRRFGDAADQKYPVVAAAPNGDIVMAAQVSGTIDVGTGPLPTKGQDLLIARFAP
jgi:hypothetical protein